MTDFEQIKIDIINQLSRMPYKVGDIDDIGNEIGIAIGKYTMLKNAEAIGTSKSHFICGLEHGISLIDGTH
jgi:hypothetical protein